MPTRPTRRPALLGVGLLLMAGAWLTIRIAAGAHGVPPWLFWPFLAVEAFALLRVAGLGLRLGSRARRAADVPAVPVPAGAGEPAEPFDVAVLATDGHATRMRLSVLGAIQVRGARDVLLVGPADRATDRLAEEFGLRRVVEGTVEDPPRATRLALAALDASDATHVALVSADSVVHHEVLALSTPALADPQVGWVQSMARSAPERDVLHGVANDLVGVADGANGVADWTVNASVVRRAAWASIASSLETRPTSPGEVRATMLAAGWSGAWSTVSLAVANGPERGRHDAEVAASVSRLRVWCSRRCPAFARGLSLRARVAAVCSLAEDLRGLVGLILLGVVIATLLTGEVPIPTVSWALLVAGVGVHVVNVVARWRLTDRRVGPLATARTTFEAIDTSVAVVTSLLVGRVVGADRSRVHVGFVAAAALLVALALRAVSQVLGWPLPSPGRGEEMIALTAGVATTVPLLRAIDVIVPMSLRRNSSRVGGDVQVAVDGAAVDVLDIGPSGVGVRQDLELPVGTVTSIRLRVPGREAPLRIAGIVRSSVLLEDDRHRTGIEFVDMATSARDELMGFWAAAWVPTAADPRSETPARSADVLKVQVNRRSSPVLRVVAALTLVATGVASLPPYGVASAAAALPENTLALSKQIQGVDADGNRTPGTTLLGGTTAVQLTAYNTWSAADGASETYHHVSLRDVLPAGTAFVAGSAEPTPSAVIEDRPGPGETTLVWQDVGAAAPGASQAVSYELSQDVAASEEKAGRALVVGDTVGGRADVYAATVPGEPPMFDDDGVAVLQAGPQIVADASGSATVVPIQIARPAAGAIAAPLLRGAHRPTTRALTVTATPLVPTTAAVVDEYLPAGVEFLGCGTRDHTPDAPGSEGGIEYPGAPRLDGATQLRAEDGCTTPRLVETVEGDLDEDGPVAKDVHTHVQWALGDLEPGAVRTLSYLVAVPQRENATWPEDATPGAECKEETDACEQLANLGNNRGAPTGEGSTKDGTEDPSRTVGVATVRAAHGGELADGGPSERVWSTATGATPTADLGVELLACNPVTNGAGGERCPNGVEPGGSTDWSLRLSAGEYRDARDLVVRAQVPDGLEYEPGSATISQTGEQWEPELLDGEQKGSQELIWKAPRPLDAGVELPLVFRTRTLDSHRATGAPVAVGDRFDLRVDVSAVTTVSHGDDDRGDRAVELTATGSLSSSWRALSATVLTDRAASERTVDDLRCATGHGQAADPDDDVARFSPGDLVCVELTMDLPPGVPFRSVELVDRLPAGAEFVGVESYEDHTPKLFDGPEVDLRRDARLVWTAGDPSGEESATPEQGARFHVVVGTRVATDPASSGADETFRQRVSATGRAAEGGADLRQRAEVGYRVARPVLSVTKGVVDILHDGASVDGTTLAAPTAGDDLHNVAQGDVLTYRIDVANTGVQFRDPGRDLLDPSDDVAATRVCRDTREYTDELAQANQMQQQVLRLFRGDETQEELDAAEAERAAAEELALEARRSYATATKMERTDRSVQQRLSTGMKIGAGCSAPSRIRDTDMALETAQETQQLLRLDGGEQRLAQADEATEDARAAEQQMAAKVAAAAAAPADGSQATDETAAEEDAGALRSQTRLSSGTRINSAADDPGGLDGGGARDDAEGLALNSARGDAQAADALAVEVWDQLPPELGCDAFLRTEEGNPDGGTALVLREGALPLAVAPEAKVVSSECDPDTGLVRLTVDHVPVGYDLQLHYKVLVPPTAAAGSRHTDVAGVRAYTDLGAAVPYYPEGNIDREIGPDAKVAANAPGALDAATVELPTLRLDSTTSTSVEESANDLLTQAAIGERVTRSVVLTVPPGTSLYDLRIADVLPEGLRLVPGSLALTRADATLGDVRVAEEPEGAGWTLQLDGHRNDSAEDQLLTLSYDTTVADVASSVAGNSLVDTVELRWNLAPGDDQGAVATTTTGTTVVVEPEPTLAQSHTPDSTPSALTGDSVISSTLTIGNATGRSPLHDVVVTDCVPAGLGSITPTGDTAAYATVESDPTPCAGDATRVRWDLSALLEDTGARGGITGLQADETVVVGYDATLVAPVAAEAALVGTSEVSGSSLSGAVDGERTSYRATTTDEVTTAPPSVRTTVSPAPERLPGAPTVLTVEVTVPAGTVTHDLTVLEELPADLLVDAQAEVVVADPECALDDTAPHVLTPEAPRLGWFLGDVSAWGGDCTVTVELTLHVGADATVGDTLRDDVVVHWNVTDRADDVAELSGAGFDRALDATAAVVVVAPELVLERTTDAVDGEIEAGQRIGHTLTLTNTGGAAAHDIDLEESFPAGLAAPTELGGTCRGAESGALDDAARTVSWTGLFPDQPGLEPGASCTVSFVQVADPATAATLADGGSLRHQATATSWWGDPLHATGTDGGWVEYGPTSAELVLTGQLPELSLATFAGTHDEVADADVGVPFTWTLVVTNAGNGPARGLDVTDTLPANWTFDPGSVVVDATDAAGCAPGAAATAPSLGAGSEDAVQTVAWSDLCDLPGGAALTIAFTATPQAAAAVAPGLVDADGERVLHPNLAVADATDAGGAQLGSVSDDAAARLRSADLQIVTTDASPDGEGGPDSAGVDVGGEGRYHLDVRHLGPDPASGPIVVTETLPLGLEPTSASGDGWACDLSGRTVTCTRTDPLAVDASAARITVVVLVGAAALDDPASGTGRVTTTASVVSPTPDPDPANNVDDESTPVRGQIQVPLDGDDSSATAPDDDPGAEPDDGGTTSTVPTTVPATAARLSLVASDGDAAFTAGQGDGRYHLTVTNLGDATESGPVVVRSTIDEHLRLVAVAGTGWDCEAVPGTGDAVGERGSFTCTWVASGATAAPVAAGDSLDPIEVQVEVSPGAVVDPRPGAANTVRLRAEVEGTDDTAEHRAEEPTPVLAAAQLRVALRHDAATAPWAVGTTQEFTVAVANDGPSGEYGDVVVSDTLPAGLGYVDAAGDGWECELRTGAGRGPNGTVRCVFRRGPLAADRVLLAAAGELAPISLRVEVLATATANPQADPALPTDAVTNEVVVDGVTDEVERTATDSVAVQPMADLGVTVTDRPTTSRAGRFRVGSTGELVLEVVNHGPSPAAGPIRVVDTLPRGLSFESGSGSGWFCSAGSDAAEVVCVHDGSLAVDESSSIILVVRVGALAHTPAHADDADPSLLATTSSSSSPTYPTLRSHEVRHLVSVTGPTSDAHTGNDHGQGVLTIDPLVDLSIRVSHQGDAAVTSVRTLRLDVTNAGPSPLAGRTVTVVNSLPAGLVARGVRGDDWVCTQDADSVVLTCTTDRGLPVGASLPPIELDVEVAATAVGVLTDRAEVSSPVDEVGTADNVATDELVVVPLANLSLELALQGQLSVGSQGVWRLDLRNDGPFAAAEPAVVAELPAGLTEPAASGDGFACTAAGSTVSCRRTAALPAGAAAELLVTGMVAGPAGSDLVVDARVSTTTAETTDEDNSASAGGPVFGVAAGAVAADGTDDGFGAGVAGNSQGQSLPARLAFTGLSVLGILAAGVAFVVGGFMFTGFGRRRRSRA